jgi:hypothetical protein
MIFAYYFTDPMLSLYHQSVGGMMPIFDQKPKQQIIQPQKSTPQQSNQGAQLTRTPLTDEQFQRIQARSRMLLKRNLQLLQAPGEQKNDQDLEPDSIQNEIALDAKQNDVDSATQNDLENTTEPVMLEETSPEIATAIKTVMRYIESQNFEGAARFLKALPKKILVIVLEKVLGKAPKFSASKITAEQLADILKGTLAKIPKSLLDTFNKMKSFKAGKWDPKGNIDKGAYIGTEVHNAIAQKYRDSNSGDDVFLNHSPISSILKSFPGSNVATLAEKARLKPDILNVTKRHLYEIKPETNATAAVLERDMYVELFKLAGVDIQRGPSNAPGTSGVVQAPGGFAVYYSPVPGVVLYRKRNGDFDPYALPVAATAEEQEKNKQQQPTQSPALASSGLSAELEKLRADTGLSPEAFLLLMIFSEATRILFPARNFLPIP